MARANRLTRNMKNRQLRNRIHSRRLAQARKAEDAREAEKAAPIRELMAGHDAVYVPTKVFVEVQKLIRKHWPTRNKTKRGFMIFGITKSMLSRSRRKLNNVVVAD